MRVSNKLTLLIVLLTIVFGLAGWSLLSTYRGKFEKQIQSAEVQRNGLALRMVLSRAVGREVRSLGALAHNINLSSPQKLQSMTDMVPQASKAIAGVVVIGSDGKILAATNREHLGEDVSGRASFRSGLLGIYMTDPRATDSANGSVFDLVRPIRDEQGNVDGVIMYKLRTSWLQDFIAHSAQALGVDAFLVDPEGKLIVSATTQSDRLPSQAVIQAAQLNLMKNFLEVEKRGKGSVSASIPNALGDTVPANSWSLIVRTRDSLPAGLSQGVLHNAELSFVALLACLALCLIGVVKFLMRPIEQQSRALLGFAKGEMIYPTEYSGSREARELGETISLLQTRFDELLSRAAEASQRRMERRRSLREEKAGGPETELTADAASGPLVLRRRRKT